MKRLLAVAAAALVVATSAHAAVPKVDARAYYVVDGTTGEVLASKNANDRLPIASITKLMTVLVALQSPSFGTRVVVTVHRAVAEVGESTIDLHPGERITSLDLVEAALVQSANDAADALADHYGPGEPAFIARMNARARKLGLRGTHFVRPDGLDAPGHLSTARDVTRLAYVAMHVPFIRQIVRLRTARISGGRVLHTWNDLLGQFRGLDGVKTGHTGAAGWCEVAEVRRDGLDVYATVLGSPTRGQRNADLAALLRWAVGVERPTWVVAPGRVYARLPTGYGRGSIPLVGRRPFLRAVRIDRPLVERVVAPPAATLPVLRGATLGEVRIFSGGRLIAREPLVAARGASRPSLGGRLGFYTRRTFEHIGGWFT